ncbi:MAG TPA: hypothetical protein VFU43_20075 [Streptosporangiaceae bacterium]|nr:hypothetical protein [Streptosporangiaceae bacterium]
MSKRGGLELSPTQLVAGGLATATATVAASYLGVAGTIIGAAFMSIATTAGGAIYQYYLDRGRRRYATLVMTDFRHRLAGGAAGEPPPGEMPEGMPGERGPEEPKRQAEPVPASAAEAADADDAAEAAATRAEPVVTAKPRPARLPRWYVLAGAAFAIFAVVIGGITLVESAADKPVSAMLGRSDRSGTSLGDTFGDGGTPPTRHPVVPTSPGTTPTPTPTTSVDPSQVPSAPATEPLSPPSADPSDTATTRPPAPTPTTQNTAP